MPKSRYQQALEPAGLAQCPDSGAIDASDYGKVNYYVPYSCFMHTNAFIRGHGKWVVHAKDLLNMKPLRHLRVGLVVVILSKDNLICVDPVDLLGWVCDLKYIYDILT
jgi:hypothetical protein